jgi:hypothetical protein
MPGQDGAESKPRLSGEELALHMVEQLTILNSRIGQLIQITEGLCGLADTLNGHFEVIHLAMDITKGLKGKQKPTIVDFAECWVEAADEILPEEEGEGGDIPVPQR